MKKVKVFVAMFALVATVAFAGGQADGRETSPMDAAPHFVVYNNSGGGTGPGSEAGSTPEDYEMVQNYIFEQTGVVVDNIRPPKEGAAERLSLLLASGDPPDVWWGPWKTYRAAGIIQPITDLVEQYGQDVYRVWNDPWDAWTKTTDANGVIWAVPRYTAFASYFLFVRQDWLDRYGMSQPTTLEELDAFLYRVKEDDPYGGGQTIPLIHRGPNVGSSLDWALAGGFTEPGRSVWVNDNGQVMPRELAPGYRDFIALLVRWYADGIIHKENFGWDAGTVRDHIARGDVAVSAAYYTDVSQYSETMRANIPGASFDIYEPGVIGPNGEPMMTINPGSNSKVMVFHASTDQETAIAAMRVINWTHENWYNFQTATWGIENVHWRYTDHPQAEELRMTTFDEQRSGYYGDFCFSIGLPFERFGVKYDTDGERNMHNLWLAEHLDDYDAGKMTEDFDIVWDTSAFVDNIPGNSDIERIINEELVKFVTGRRELTDREWDSFVEELYDAGLDDWITEYTRQYNEARNN